MRGCAPNATWNSMTERRGPVVMKPGLPARSSYRLQLPCTTRKPHLDSNAASGGCGGGRSSVAAPCDDLSNSPMPLGSPLANDAA
eukprot:4903920-Prymnesium_polylepis.1